MSIYQQPVAHSSHSGSDHGSYDGDPPPVPEVTVRAPAGTHIYTYTHIHMDTHIYTHAHIHTHTYTYTHTVSRLPLFGEAKLMEIIDFGKSSHIIIFGL